MRLCEQDAQVHIAYDVRSEEDDAHLEAWVPTPLHAIIVHTLLPGTQIYMDNYNVAYVNLYAFSIDICTVESKTIR